jgi:hypothetical protein
VKPPSGDDDPDGCVLPLTTPGVGQEKAIYGPPHSYLYRRARHHRLFARGAKCATVRRSHDQLARIYWVLAALSKSRGES